MEHNFHKVYNIAVCEFRGSKGGGCEIWRRVVWWQRIIETCSLTIPDKANNYRRETVGRILKVSKSLS